MSVLDFALAFIHNQDTKTLTALQSLIHEARLYGAMEGFAKRILGRMERYPTVVAIVWAVVSTIISIILAILLKISL